MVKGLIVGAVCAAAILVADERGVVNASAASSSSIESGRVVVGMGTVGAVAKPAAAAPVAETGNPRRGRCQAGVARCRAQRAVDSESVEPLGSLDPDRATL